MMPRALGNGRTFDVHVEHGVVVLALRGLLQFEETSTAIAAAAEAAKQTHSRKALFDLRLADASNYYSYAVRHAEAARELGLELESFQLAFLGKPEADDVLYFMAAICQNRGWPAKHFTDWESAIDWLGADRPSPQNP